MGEIVPQRIELTGREMEEGDREESALAIATTRAAEEVKARMVVAKRFPRDEAAAYARVMKSCQRKSLAELAEYEYPRGGEIVRGPSIRLAEAIGRAWGNIDFGFVELSQRDGQSAVEAYAWDMETNTRICRTFTVPHVRNTKKGSYRVTDSRDIYEMVANQAQRRVRACILGIIPGDIVEEARSACAETLAKGETTPLSDRVRRMVTSFGEFNVTAEMISEKLGHKLEMVTESELVKLRGIYTSLKEGASDPAQWFTPPEDPARAALRKELIEKGVPPGALPPKTAAPAAEPNIADVMAAGQKTTAPEPAAKATQKAEPAPAPTQEAQPPLDREELAASYQDLCDAVDEKPRPISTMKTPALFSEVQRLRAKLHAQEK